MLKFLKQKYQGSLEYLLVISGAILVAVIVLMVLSGTPITNNETAIDDSKCSPYGNQNYCNIADIEGDGIVDCIWKDNQCLRKTMRDRLKEGLVLFLKMDDSNATHTAVIQDSSGYNNNGILYTGEGATSKSIAGRYGNAITFDGTNDYISVLPDTSLDINNYLSLCAWVKLNSKNIDQKIIARVSRNPDFWGYQLDIFSDNKLEMITGGTTRWNTTRGVSGGTSLDTGTWYYVTGIFDGVRNKTYINGVLDRNNNISYGLSSLSQILNIGKSTEGTGYYFNGIIDEVAIWNRALSESEIKEIYTNGLD